MFVLPPATHAATRFVDQNPGVNCIGNYNPATRACGGGSFNSYTTIPAGVAAMAGGDTLYIRAGTYKNQFAPGAGQVTIFNPPSGTAAAPTVIRGYPGEAKPKLLSVPINGPTGEGALAIFISPGNIRSYIEFRGLEIEMGGGFAMYADGSHHLRFTENFVHDTSGQGIIMGSAGSDNYVGYNHFLRVGQANPGYKVGINTIYGIGTRGTIEYNIFDGDNTAIAVYCSACSKTMDDYVIRGNVIRNGGYQILPDGAVGPPICLCSGGSGHKVYNNVIYNTKTGPNGAISAMTSFWGSAEIYNNTIYNNTGGYGVALHTGAGSTVRNNILYQTGGILIIPGKGTQSENLTSNPLFVNPAAGDFHLQPNSPAINSGANLYAQGVTVDFDGKARPTSGTFEIGAFEFGPGTPVANAAPAKVRGLRWR